MFEASAHTKLQLNGRPITVKHRFDAYVALSPSGAGSIFSSDSRKDIRKPMFVLTGTRDKGFEGTWEWRTPPYDGMPVGCKWLGVIDGATHMNFAGVGFAGKTEKLTLENVYASLDDARSGHCALPPAESGITMKSK